MRVHAYVCAHTCMCVTIQLAITLKYSGIHSVSVTVAMLCGTSGCSQQRDRAGSMRGCGSGGRGW